MSRKLQREQDTNARRCSGNIAAAAPRCRGSSFIKDYSRPTSGLTCFLYFKPINGLGGIFRILKKDFSVIFSSEYRENVFASRKVLFIGDLKT